MNRSVAVTAVIVIVGVLGGCAESSDAEARGAYCYGVATLDNTGVFDAADREQTEHEVAEARVALDAVRDNAPDETEDDARTVTSAFAAVLDDIEQADFDASGVEVAAAMGIPDVEAAARRFRDENADVCGVELP